ncbi:hypothetical protein Mal15_04340 [Stieleria maiorica]|uniref:Double zinc ribbon n=1 Tax=Stieleria maiorica TaxID=2795974 RepID=A0A5B9M8B4_9BACT|nr:hypothetical protein [Stieleria maiorica]QEF96406.1 hypothetical protein Mal15_04340 [Stieleria maiorica]
MSESSVAERTCGRCESPLETGDLRCAICGQAALDAQADVPKKLAVQILRCTGCGAAIAYDPKHQAPSCSFCGDVVKVESIDDPMEQTEHYLPFTVTPDEARAALRGWLDSRGWFRPSDLSASAQLTQLKPLWWVAWVFDADAFVSWAADSNEGSGRSDWAPHSGQNEIHFDDILVSASRGLSVREAAAISPGMNLATKRAAPEGAVRDATLEQFDVQRSQARQEVSAAIHRMAAERAQNHFIPGTRFRNVHVAIVLRRLVTRRLSLPAYVLAYRYKENLYRVVICGQDKRLMVGTSPKSLLKMIAVALMVGVIALVILGIMAG